MLCAVETRGNWALQRHVVQPQLLTNVNTLREHLEEPNADVDISVCAILSAATHLDRDTSRALPDDGEVLPLHRVLGDSL